METAVIFCISKKMRGFLAFLSCIFFSVALQYHRLTRAGAVLPAPIDDKSRGARDLKNAGYDLYLLSNASTRQHTYWHDIPGSEYFSGTFISADYRLLKPEDAIYQAFFRKFGLKPEDCLFIDDSPANIEASENAGMAGIVFHGDAAHLRCQLADRGIL